MGFNVKGGQVARITFYVILITATLMGLAAIFKSCSPEFGGGEGAGAVGGGWQSMGFFCYGVILLVLSCLALFMLKANSLPSGWLKVAAAVCSIGIGIAVLRLEVIRENPFTRSNSGFLYLLPDGSVSLIIGAGFVVMGISAFIDMRRDSGTK